jgi:hypothetical protein
VIRNYVQRNVEPAEVIAVRYVHGQPYDDLRLLAEYEYDTPEAGLVEVPEWRSLLIRLGHADDPDYLVVPDGAWLVYNKLSGCTAVWDDDSFAAKYGLPPEPGLLAAVASAIGQHMILRESTTQIAAAALAAADAYREET